MKKTIQRWCVCVGLWLAKLGGYASPTPADLKALASTLTKRQDTLWPERDGECKRAAVYSQLTNTFPQHSKRVISRAIEEAIECGA